MSSIAGAHHEVNVGSLKVAGHLLEHGPAVFSGPKYGVVTIWNFGVELDNGVDVTLVLLGSVEFVGFLEDTLEEIDSGLGP